MTPPASALPRVAYRPETPWTPLAAAGVVLVSSFAPLAVSLLAWAAKDAGLLGAAAERTSGAIPSLASRFVLAQMMVGQLLSLAIIWGAAGWKGARRETLRLGRPQTGWLAAVGYGVLLIAVFGPLEVVVYRLADVDLFTDGRWILDGLSSPHWWAVVCAAVVLAPLAEEITFRGFLLSALAKSRLGFWPAALISSTAWAGLHAGYSWPGLVSVFLAGLGLSAIMRRTGSMRAVVVAHAVVNAFSLTTISLFAP